jgi:NADH-quinone oxidoreductase subunit N
MLLLQANTTSLINYSDLRLIAPELILTVCACVALVMEVILPYRKSKLTAYFSLIGIALAFVSLALQKNMALTDGFYGMVRIDGFAILFRAIFLISAALAIGISTRYLDIEGEQHGEYYSLILFATVGMMFIACGYDLISLYISLELMALTFYVLVAFTKREKKSNEAAMKYFLLGAFSSGILLYGMSMIYGVAGSTNIGEIGRSFSDIVTKINATINDPTMDKGILNLRPLLLLGMIALGAGLFFKIAAVPFHMWAPDVYEGAPTSVTAFLSTGSKAASFALYARIFSEALPAMRADWAPLLGLVAAITIMVGNWAAVTQENSKRLLAYSSISNAGYLLLALIANNEYGRIGLIVYLFVYTLMNMGAFGVIISLRRRGIIGDNVDDLTGLAHKAPVMAAMMAIFMLSLGGLPVTGGFIGKYFLFGGLIQQGAAEHKTWYYWLAGWAIINTVVSFAYYFRFIKVMYLGDRIADNKPLALSPALQVALAVAVIGIIAVGVFPQPVIELAKTLMPSV